MTAATAPGRATVLQQLRDHLPFLVLLAVAAVVRLVALLAYRPVLWFPGDSYAYLGVAMRPDAYDVRPIGYSFFLESLQPFERLSAAPAAQHLLGLAVGTAGYALLRHLGVRRWLAVLAAAPVLLDAFQVQLEQMLMADTLGLALVALAFGLLLGPERPSVATCAWAGAVLATASLTRTVALVLVVPAVGYLLVRRAGVLRVLALVALFALPLHLYAGWFFARHESRALSSIDGFFLYGRVMPFATCDGLDLQARHVVLCEARPPERRAGVEFYIWDEQSPAYRVPGPRAWQNVVLREFALKVIRNQPGAYAKAVLVDVRDAVSPVRKPLPSRLTYGAYRFPLEPKPAQLPPEVQADALAYQGSRGTGETRPVLSLAHPLRAYQDVVHTPGTAYLAAALVAAVGLVRGARAPGQARRAAVCAVLLTSGLAVVAVPIVTQGFDYRYALPALPMLSLAGALGVELLRAGRRAPDAAAAARTPAA